MLRQTESQTGRRAGRQAERYHFCQNIAWGDVTEQILSRDSELACEALVRMEKNSEAAPLVDIRRPHMLPQKTISLDITTEHSHLAVLFLLTEFFLSRLSW